jgi:hypothetical protein
MSTIEQGGQVSCESGGVMVLHPCGVLGSKAENGKGMFLHKFLELEIRRKELIFCQTLCTKVYLLLEQKKGGFQKRSQKVKVEKKR